MQLTNFDIDVFLRDYWQKQPLLIRNPWNAWSNPLEPDELAGLACEEGVESRLIMQAGETWKLEHGPFPEARFGTLGKKRWTLLVQAVDHHVPAVAALLDPFRFVPNWRIDDVMVTYAADEGGVGPHYDQYDVFLIQGLGRRRWQIGAPCDESSALLPNEDIRLLADFVATEEWILEPGDILYVPPRVPHNGVAVGADCMTYSIGFRAPSRSELMVDWCDHLVEDMPEDDRYADDLGDSGVPRQDNPGEISASALAGLQAMILEKMADPAAFARWFGEANSLPKYPETDWQPEEPIGVDDVRAFIAQGAALTRNPASRFAFIRQEAGGLLLFVDGVCFDCAGDSVALAERLCAQNGMTLDAAVGQSDDAVALIAALANQGSVAFEESE